MIRILQVMGGMNRRGAESFIMNIYRKIDRTHVQFDFLVYTNEKQDFEDEITTLGGRVIHMPCSSGIGALRSIPQIKRIIRTYGPYKAIHAHTLYNICYSMLAARSVPEMLRISHSHSTKNRLTAGFFQRAYEWMSRSIIRHYTQVMVACGENAGEFLFGSKFRKEGIILKNGVDLDKHCSHNENAIAAIKGAYGLTDKLVIGSVAHFYEIKNHVFMVEIAKALKSNGTKFKMLFIGRGGLIEKIRKNVIDCDLQNEVIFLGTRTDINDLMYCFDVFLMPSHFEGNPVTLVEAQAAGLPCVITNSITDEMDMGLGLIHKCSLSSSASQWTDTIVEAAKHRCMDENEIRKRIAACGYDAQITADQMQQLYQK